MTVSHSSSFSLPDLLEEATQRLKPIYKNGVDSSTLSIVWGHTCIFIEEQLLKGKAVTIQGLGTFTYIHKKQDLGTKGVKITKTPLFVVSDSFCQANDVKKDNFSNLTTSVPSVPVNNSLIASQSETTRDVVIDFQKEAIRGIGAAIRGHKGVSIEIKNIGHLIYSGGVLKASFNSDFVAQFQVSIPTKTGSYEDSLPENIDPANTTTKSSPSSSPKLKVNNFLASPATSRSSTPREDMRERSVSKSVILPQVDRPRNPMIKLRANSDSALRPISPFHESITELDTSNDDEVIIEPKNDGRRRKEESEREEEWEEEDSCEECEHCIIARFNEKAARLKRIQEKTSDEAALRAQKSALHAMEEKEQVSLKVQKARREESDNYNRTILAQKQENAAKQKKMDFYGDVFYARKPDVPEHVKKTQLKTALQDQISDKQTKQKQKQQEVKKEFETFHESQKQADERARKLKLDEKQRLKEHGDYLVQQMTQKVKPKDEPRFERSVNPSLLPLSSLQSKTFAEDLFRPSTADREFKRRDFDTLAVDHHKEAILQRRFREEEEKSQQAKESLENARVYNEMMQQQQQEEMHKKNQTKELLRSAWDSQLAQKRSNTLAELTKRNAPHRASLDLGQLAMERNKIAKQHQHNCKNCGRHFTLSNNTNFRRTSGDYRVVK